MRMLLLAAVASLALSGCQTASIDTAIQTNLPKVCAGARTAHLAFTAATLTGKIPARTIGRENAAWAALEPLCENPSAETAGSVLVAALAAYTTIAAALRDAQG